MAKTTVRQLLALSGFVLIGWALGAICRSELTPTDLRIVRDVAADRTSTQTAMWHAVSFICSGYVVFPLALVCCAILYRRRRQSWSLAVGMITFGAAAIANIDKILVRRPRPPVHHLEAVTGQSFPSGHASHTAAFCTALVLVLCAARPGSRLRLAAATVSALLVLAVSFSRVYLGVHYLSDVAGGALLGVTWAVAAWRLTTHLRSSSAPNTMNG
jgi:undecaprenyl-diphosphatase